MEKAKLILTKIIDAMWMRESSPEQLAFLRVFLGGYALFYVFTRQKLLTKLVRGSDYLFQPVGLAHFLKSPLSPETFDIFLIFTIILGVLFVLGLGYRVVGPLFAVCFLAILSYRNSWSMIYHARNLVCLHVFILGFVPAADALSLDKLIPFLNKKMPKGDIKALKYGWPIAMISTVTAIVYFLAGFAKLAGPEGIAWMAGRSMQGQVLVNAIRYAVLELQTSSWLSMLAGHEWFFTLTAIGAILMELLAPGVLLSRRIGVWWSIACVGMHWGILAIMGIKFFYQLLGLAFLSFLVQSDLWEFMRGKVKEQFSV